MTDVHRGDDDQQPEDAVAHATDEEVAHAHDAHADDAHGDDAHGHAEEPLGPIDAPAWGAGLIGVIAGLAVGVAFVLATAPI